MAAFGACAGSVAVAAFVSTIGAAIFAHTAAPVVLADAASATLSAYAPNATMKANIWAFSSLQGVFSYASCGRRLALLPRVAVENARKLDFCGGIGLRLRS